MDNPDESFIRWEMIKGVVVSQLAIVSALIRNGVISKEQIFNELEIFINGISEKRPEAIFFLEPLKALQDAVSTLPDEYEESIIDFLNSWFTNGHA